MKRIDSNNSNYDDLRISTTPRSLKPRTQSIQHMPTPSSQPQRDPQIFFDGTGVSATLDWLLAKDKLKLLFTMHRCWDIVANKVHLPPEPVEEDFTLRVEDRLYHALEEHHNNQLRILEEQIQKNANYYCDERIQRNEYDLVKEFERTKFTISMNHCQRKHNYLISYQLWCNERDAMERKVAKAIELFYRHLSGVALGMVRPYLVQQDSHGAWARLDTFFARDRSELLSMISRLAFNPHEISYYDFINQLNVIFYRLQETEESQRPVSDKMKLDSLIHAIRNGSFGLFRDFLTFHAVNMTSYEEFLRCLERKVFEIMSQLPPQTFSSAQPSQMSLNVSHSASQSFYGEEY